MRSIWFWALVVGLVVVALGCLSLWFWGTGRASDFGLNAFTETLGILVTVIVVDALLRRHEQRRLLPVRIAAFHDVAGLTNEIVGFWADAHRWGLPDASPSSIEELLQPGAFARVAQRLNMDSAPEVLPARTWWEFLPERLRHQRNVAERTLERHAVSLDPAALGLVHRLATDGPDPGTISVIRALDHQNSMPRPRVMGEYWLVLDTYWDALRALLRWCRDERARLSNESTVELGTVAGNVTWPPNPTPPCMISLEELDRQHAALKAWRAAKSSLPAC